MNREIKFRAWDDYNKMIIPDWLTQTRDGFEFDGYDTTNNTVGVTDIMQYTGLKDKNGVEIFEGDVIKTSLDGGDSGYRNCEVIFQEGCFCLKHDLQITWPIFDYNVSTYEVIGNIYKNQDLLK